MHTSILPLLYMHGIGKQSIYIYVYSPLNVFSINAEFRGNKVMWAEEISEKEDITCLIKLVLFSQIFMIPCLLQSNYNVIVFK